MTLKLAKNNAPQYNYLSLGDGSNPAAVSATLDGSGGSLDTSTQTLYLVATQFNYTGISLSVTSQQVGISWQMSTDGGATWTDSADLPDMDALAADLSKRVDVKAVVANNGSVSTGVYAVPNIVVSAIENPV